VAALLSDRAATADQIALATLAASRKLFGQPEEGEPGILSTDPGLTTSFYVLVHAAFRARDADFLHALRERGIRVPDPGSASAIGFVGGVSETVRERLAQSENASPFSEIALLSLREVLSDAIAQRATALFGSDLEKVQSACRYYATPTRFGALSRRFFAAFLYRTLTFFVSKEIHRHVGPGKRFHQLSDAKEFEHALRLWCSERARIIESFAGGWTSKEEHEGGVDRRDAQRFVAVAVGKLASELGADDAGANP
jgi:hypothetical protein